MKPTTSQLLTTASTILGRLIESGNEASDEQNVKRAVTLAMMLADEVPETAPIHDKESILNAINATRKRLANVMSQNELVF